MGVVGLFEKGISLRGLLAACADGGGGVGEGFDGIADRDVSKCRLNARDNARDVYFVLNALIVAIAITF